jgi:hypothetical protein
MFNFTECLTSHSLCQRQPAIKVRVPKQLHIRLEISRVYFLQESSIGAIKIGTTKNVNTRVRTAATYTPHTLSVIASISGNHEIKIDLHRRFADARIRRRGEWFRPVPELLAYIAEIKARTV